MAGDEKAAGPEASEGPATPTGGVSHGAPAEGPLASEWTLSDKRGGLNEAGETPVAADASALSGEPTAGVEPAGAATATKDTTVASLEAREPDAADPRSPAGATELSRRPSRWPVAAGIVLGALIGAGSAAAIYRTAPAADASFPAAYDQKLAALTKRVGELAERPDPRQTLAPLQASVTDLSGKVAALDAAARRPSSSGPVGAVPAAAASPPTAVSASDLTALQQKVAGLDAALRTLQGQTASSSDLSALQGKLVAITAALSDTQKQTGAARSEVQTLQSGQKTLEGKITGAPALAVVADSLVRQIRRGQPFASQLNVLASLGVDGGKITVLRQFADQGVPSAAVLAGKFEPLTDTILSGADRSDGNAGFWSRMKANAGGLVSIHRVDDIDGNDAPSRVARIKADLSRDDVADAYATWMALPAATKAKPAVAAWGALAKTHVEALTAATAVEQGAIAALATKKS